MWSVIGVALAIGVPLVSALWAKANTNAGDITDVRERTAKLEEAVSTIKQDTGEIKGDIKTLLGAIKK